MMNGLGNLGHLGRLGHVSTSGTNHPEVEASGRAFPIWNTKSGDNKLMSLSIHGRTEQIGTPTPANPVPMRSVGDTGLLLSVMPDKAGSDYQLLNIKEAMKKAGHDGILRSVNGIYDEVVYNGKEWKLIQRIQNDRIITCTGVSNHQEVGFTDCYFYPTKAPINGSISNGLLSTHFVQGNNGVGTINLNNNSPYLGIFRYPNTGADLTKEEITAWLGENEVYVSYQLAEPAEYPLDLPVITTYDEQTYFASNAAEVKPRMVAQCKVSKALDYIREGLIGYYTGRGRSNTDENKNILPDLSGNGNDLENKNFAYTINSGYGDGYIQYDGIDDFSMLPTDKNFKSGVKTQMFVFSATQSTTETDNKWNGGIVTEYYFAIQRNQVPAKSDYEQVYLNGTDVKSIGFNISDSTEINTIVISRTKNASYFNKNLNLSTILNAPIYCIKQRFHDALLYERVLTEEEILHNYKVSCQYNGEDFSFDPIEQNLIASYRTYDKTNEAEDRDILKDLSGNGHDIQLHNFAFSEGSGYGLYGDQFDTLKTHNNSVSKTYKKIEVTKELTSSYIVYNQTGVTSLNGMKVKVSNLPKERTLIYMYKEADDANSATRMSIVADGIYDLPGSVKTSEGIQSRDYGFMVDRNNITGFVGLTIELIPDYQGALVSDGVDDFGICDNFPVLTKEKGYTVCAIRKWLNIDFIKSSEVFLSTRVHDENNENPTQWGSFTLEKILNGNNMQVINFGAITLIENKNILLMQDVFTYLNSKKYNGKDIVIGNAQHTPRLNLFAGYTFLQQPSGKAELSNIALYAIEIYDRDLTDEEIAKVKERMIAEYELKTGNKYEEG